MPELAVVDPEPAPDGRPIGAVARELYERAAPIQPDDERYGWALLALVRAWSAPLEVAAWIARDHPDGRSGWAHLLDPMTTLERFLPFLAARLGVRLAPELDVDRRRITIRDRPAAYTGTPAHMKAAARVHLTDPESGHVELYERLDGDPDTALLVTYEAETPDPAAVVRAVSARDVKPAGLNLSVRCDPGWSVALFETAYSALTVADVEVDFATVRDFESNIPS